MLTSLKSIVFIASALVIQPSGKGEEFDPSPIVIELKVVKDKHGTESYVSPTLKKTNDIIERRIVIRSGLFTVLPNFELQDKIPSYGVFQKNISEKNPVTIFEVKTASSEWSLFPISTFTPDHAGVLRSKKVPNNAYTHVRWRFPRRADAGEAITVRYRLKVVEPVEADSRKE